MSSTRPRRLRSLETFSIDGSDSVFRIVAGSGRFESAQPPYHQLVGPHVAAIRTTQDPAEYQLDDGEEIVIAAYQETFGRYRITLDDDGEARLERVSEGRQDVDVARISWAGSQTIPPDEER